MKAKSKIKILSSNLNASLKRDNNIVKVKLALFLGETVNSNFAYTEGIEDFNSIIEYISSQGIQIDSLNENGLENYFINPETVVIWREWFLSNYGDQTYEGLKP